MLSHWWRGRERPYGRELEETQRESAGTRSTSSFALMQRVYSGMRPQIQLPQVPTLFQELLPACWHQDPEHRPSFDHVLREIHASGRPPTARRQSRRRSSWFRAGAGGASAGAGERAAPESKPAPAVVPAPVSADELEASLAPVMEAYEARQ